MESLKDKSALMLDYGLFAPVAERLARDFKEVFYYCPWKTSFCKSAPAHVGTGLAPNLRRVLNFWDYVPRADVVVFGEVMDADVQRVVIEKFGKPVLGQGAAESLETDRRGTRALQKRLGIAAPPTRYFTDVDELAKYLEKNEDKWVKVSTFRGDGETWHHTNWHVTETYLHRFRHAVGAIENSYEFCVEDNIEGVEVGYDGWHVRGQFPTGSYWGFEVKDLGYVGKFSPYDELPKPIRDINLKLAPVLARAGAAGFCSFEFRLGKDGVPYLIDPCMRFASPPTEALVEGYANFSEIVWAAANGRMVDPDPSGEYLAIALLVSEEAEDWAPLDIPDDIRRWVKVRNAAVIDGKLYYVPTGHGHPEVGAVVAVADALDEAIDLVKERADRVKGFRVGAKTEALDEARKYIEEAKEYGIEF